MSVRALSLTLIYISTIVVQLFLPINILSPVQLIFGTVILLRSAFIQPRERGWDWRVLKFLAIIALFLLFLIGIQRNPEISLLRDLASNTITLIIIVLIFQQSGELIRYNTANKWQEKLKVATFITAFAVLLAGIFYNPYNERIIIPIAGIIGHIILGGAYFYSLQSMYQYSEQLVLELDSDEWLYRQVDLSSDE